MAGIPSDHFSARWQGEIETHLTEAYTLIVRSDDGVRVWIDGNLTINDWTYHGASDATGVLPPGRHQITIEYMEGGGDASAQLLWQGAHEVRRVVPASQLYPIQGLIGSIPLESAVSPVYIEVSRSTGSTPIATVNGASIPISPLDDTISYVTALSGTLT